MTAASGLPWVSMLFSVALAAVGYFVVQLIRPKPPHSFLWGHLELVGEIFAALPDKSHIQVVVTTLQHKYHLPGAWYLDLWPFMPPQLFITDPDLALYTTVHKNHPKHALEAYFVDPVVGERNIVTSEGQHWKYLHNMLSPAFAISHTRNMTGMIAAQVMKFRSKLQSLAQSGKNFKLEELVIDMTFDIIGTSVFAQSYNSQQASLVQKYFAEVIQQWDTHRYTMNPVAMILARFRRLNASKRLNAVYEDMIRQRWNLLQRENVDVSQKRGLSIIDLILREHLEETRRLGTKTLDSRFMSIAVSQIRTILFAGSGTTSDTLCFAYMFLSAYPGIVQKLREEHDRAFTPGIDATYSMLCENPQKLSDLVYTGNFVKEVMRFYPVSMTGRAEDSTGFIPYQGRQYPTKGVFVVPTSHTMHMNPDVFPDPDKFDPDRFTRMDHPRHAWRPFERGPRACLGQHMAMDEFKITLLLTVRDFDFSCFGLKPNKTPRVPWTSMDLTFGDRAFQEYIFEAKPRDGMPMTVKMAAKT